MNIVLSNWNFDPFLIIAVAIGALDGLGTYRLVRRAAPKRRAAWLRRAVAFDCGLLVLVVSVMSPIDYWASDYFWVHMLEHLLLMFAAPSLVVLGAPWLPLVHALPVRFRRRAGRLLLVSSSTAWLRRTGRFLASPLVAVVSFNVVMVVWHLPVLFDAGERNTLIHIWLMHGSFFVAGMLFWLQFIPSHPFRLRLSPVGQLGSLLGTNVLMVIFAMALGVFTSTSWYQPYDHIAGVTLSPFADQQIGAAILWVCGDFWCYPALIKAFRRLQEQPEGIEGALDRFMRREARLRGAVARSRP